MDSFKGISFQILASPTDPAPKLIGPRPPPPGPFPVSLSRLIKARLVPVLSSGWSVALGINTSRGTKQRNCLKDVWEPLGPGTPSWLPLSTPFSLFKLSVRNSLWAPSSC